MVSHEHKAIFVHIPKTGGTSIEQIIWPLEKARTEADLWMGFKDKYHNKYQTGGLQHLLAVQVRKELGTDVFDRYFKFAIVRNPWTRTLSQYFFIKKRADLMSFIGMHENDCLKRYLSLIQEKEHVQWMPQHKFVFDDNGEKLVNYIGFFENFEFDVRHVLSVLNVSFGCIPHLNKYSGDSVYSIDKESYEIIANIYQRDIALFGYSEFLMDSQSEIAQR